VYGIIKGYDDKPTDQGANATVTEKATLMDWMNRHGVARLTILLGMEANIQAECTIVEETNTVYDKLASPYRSKLKLNLFDIREDLWSIKLQICGVVDNCALRIDWKVKDYHLCGGPLTTNTAPDMDTAKAIGKMSEHAHITNPFAESQ
jgi:hypothetical protein